MLEVSRNTEHNLEENKLHRKRSRKLCTLVLVFTELLTTSAAPPPHIHKKRKKKKKKKNYRIYSPIIVKYTQNISQVTRRLIENIPIWAYYPQLGISNSQLGIIYPIGGWGFMSQVKQSQRTNPQSPI